MIDANELRGMERADILITVNLPGFTTLDFSRVQQIIPKGYEAANERSGVLQRLRLSDDEWKQYVAQRESRLVKTTPTPQFVEVKGTSTDVARDIQKELSPFVNKPIDTPSWKTNLHDRSALAGLKVSVTV